MSAALQRQKDDVRTEAAQRKAAMLEYVRDMLRELRNMTAAEGEVFITHLVGMAYTATSDLIRERYANVASEPQRKDLWSSTSKTQS